MINIQSEYDSQCAAEYRGKRGENIEIENDRSRNKKNENNRKLPTPRWPQEVKK